MSLWSSIQSSKVVDQCAEGIVIIGFGSLGERNDALHHLQKLRTLLLSNNLPKEITQQRDVLPQRQMRVTHHGHHKWGC